MNFSDALELIKQGGRVARHGWNGRDMFVFLVPGSHFVVNRPPLLGIYPEGTAIDYRPHIDMRTANGEIVPWAATQSDLLADDWDIILPAIETGETAETHVKSVDPSQPVYEEGRRLKAMRIIEELATQADDAIRAVRDVTGVASGGTRWSSIALTQLQLGFMALRRAAHTGDGFGGEL